MKLLFGLLLLGVFIFIGFSVYVLIKRYRIHKDAIGLNSNRKEMELKLMLEEEIKEKKELLIKKLKDGDKTVLLELLEQVFKSTKLIGWVKSKTFSLHKDKSVSVIVNLFEKNILIETEKEITLKSGQIHKQKKHEIVIKKEYSDKVFNLAYRVIDEIFQNIPTLYKIYLSEYIPQDESSICVLSFEVNKDQYRAIKEKADKENNFSSLINYFNPNYDFDSKNFDFKEVEPINTPSGELSLEKTMSVKASTNTVLYGNTLLMSDGQTVDVKSKESAIISTGIDKNTKISDLNSSTIFDKSILGNIFNESEIEREKELIHNESEFDLLIENFVLRSGLKIIKKEFLKNDEVSLVTKLESLLLEDKILIHYSRTEDIVKSESIHVLFSKMKAESIEKAIFITNGAFSLDSVTYASERKIKLFDKEKLKKSINK